MIAELSTQHGGECGYAKREAVIQKAGNLRGRKGERERALWSADAESDDTRGQEH